MRAVTGQRESGADRREAWKPSCPTWALRAVAGLVTTAMLAACGVMGDADPMPSPGSPDPTQILVSATSALRAGGSSDVVGVIGLQRAAPGAGFIEIRNAATDTLVVVNVSSGGSFAALVPGAAGDRFLLVYRTSHDGPASRPVELPVQPLLADAGAGMYPGAPEATRDPNYDGAASSWIYASPPDARGISNLRGAVPSGQLVTVGNSRTGAVAAQVVPASGMLSLDIEAQIQDSLVVIVRDPANGLTSSVASVIVPSP